MSKSDQTLTDVHRALMKRKAFGWRCVEAQIQEASGFTLKRSLKSLSSWRLTGSPAMFKLHPPPHPRGLKVTVGARAGSHAKWSRTHTNPHAGFWNGVFGESLASRPAEWRKPQCGVAQVRNHGTGLAHENVRGRPKGLRDLYLRKCSLSFCLISFM